MQDTSKKPLIGLTPSHNLEKDGLAMPPNYCRAITHAGGIPVILPLEVSHEDLVQLVEELDGFLFTGGPDIYPDYFHEQTHIACGPASLKRDKMELDLLPLVMEAKKPVLGICRGIQLLNVALGGTIYQDIPSQFKEEFPIAHQQPFAGGVTSHSVQLVEGTRLREIACADTIRVNSFHHQAVKDLAPGLRVDGRAPSGLIEAVDLPGYPYFVGVQWHPEYLWTDNEAAARLFESFVNACR